MKFVIRTTNEYERLVQFFVKNGLEFDGDEEVDTDIIKCWKISQAVQADLTHIKDAHADGKDALVAGCVLALREGRYIIDGIAVDPVLRKEGLGKLLVDKVKQEVQARGGDAIYLVARAPGFFRRLGFETIDPQNAPNFFECKQCPQYPAGTLAPFLGEVFQFHSLLPLMPAGILKKTEQTAAQAE